MDILTNKQYKQYDKISRYAPFPIYYNKLDNRWMYGIPSSLNRNTTFINHVVKSADTLDSLALYYYGNPTYYWAIADFNNIHDAFEPLPVGMVVKVPTFSALQFQI